MYYSDPGMYPGMSVIPGILKILGQRGMAVYCILATYLGIYLGMSKLNRKLGTLWTCLGFFGHGY